MISLLLATTVMTTSCSESHCLIGKVPEFVAEVIDEATQAVDEKAAKEKAAEKRHQDDIERDKEIGRKAVEEIDKQLKASTDQEATARLKAIGAEIAEIANQASVSVMWGDPRHSKFEYTFKLVQGDDVNAFSLPGGTIYFYEGLLKFAESDDELAGVIGHEIAHAAFRHLDALQREQNKVALAQLPLLIAAAAGGGNADAVNALMAAQLVGAGLSSGWSMQAETSSDYGAIQFLKKSRYNPTGVLTFMERLGYKERLSPQIDWGIYRTHPPTGERARFIIRSLSEFGLNIRRSETTTSLSARSIPRQDGSFQIWFGDYEVAVLRGTEAKERASRSVLRLNGFLDSVPQMFQLTSRGHTVLGNGRELIEFNEGDLEPERTLDDSREKALLAIRRVISELNLRLWRG
jgi:predicted Zn-dependent protease